MKINITKKEYLILLETLEIADWVLHAHRTDPPQKRRNIGNSNKKYSPMPRTWGLKTL